jgi:voltage-gated potassium channel
MSEGRAKVVERMFVRYLQDPASIRRAMAVIVTATAIVVIGAGILMRIVDHKEYASVWVGMWWAIQTVTTVGYGDVTPAHANGRIVAVFVMLEGIAFLAIVTASITSTFVERATRERHKDEVRHEVRLEERFDALEGRLAATDEALARIEALLRERPSG